MNAEYREHLGRLVHLAWVAYCKDTGDVKPSHIAPWEELHEWDKEADRCIGEAIVRSITDVSDGERVTRQAETIRLFSIELDGLRARHEAALNVLAVARRILGCRRSDPEMHDRLTAFSTALRQYEQEYGPGAVPIP